MKQADKRMLETVKVRLSMLMAKDKELSKLKWYMHVKRKGGEMINKVMEKDRRRRGKG